MLAIRAGRFSGDLTHALPCMDPPAANLHPNRPAKSWDFASMITLVPTPQLHATLPLPQLAHPRPTVTAACPRPLADAPEMWRHEFRSAVADMTNNVKDRGNAQSACAAQFIGNHLPADWLDTEPNKWIHVDMAAPAHDKSSERATGYGVALLAALCGVNKSHFPESL